MDPGALRERLIILHRAVARIQEQNREYLAKKHHSRYEEVLNADRKARLVQILEELATLTKKRDS